MSPVTLNSTRSAVYARRLYEGLYVVNVTKSAATRPAGPASRVLTPPRSAMPPVASITVVGRWVRVTPQPVLQPWYVMSRLSHGVHAPYPMGRACDPGSPQHVRRRRTCLVLHKAKLPKIMPCLCFCRKYLRCNKNYQYD